MKKLLLPTLALVSILLFFAFAKRDVSVVVTGNVLAGGRPLPSAEVSVQFQEQSEVPAYYEPTCSQGKYLLQFNMAVGSVVYLRYQKKDYCTLLRKFSSNGKTLTFERTPVHLFKMPAQGGPLQVYLTKKNGTPKMYLSTDIPHFDFVEPSTAETLSVCDQVTGKTVKKKGIWYEVSFVPKGQDEPVCGWVLDVQ